MGGSLLTVLIGGLFSTPPVAATQFDLGFCAKTGPCDLKYLLGSNDKPRVVRTRRPAGGSLTKNLNSIPTNIDESTPVCITTPLSRESSCFP